jgi:hypothetical protein
MGFSYEKIDDGEHIGNDSLETACYHIPLSKMLWMVHILSNLGLSFIHLQTRIVHRLFMTIHRQIPTSLVYRDTVVCR